MSQSVCVAQRKTNDVKTTHKMSPATILQHYLIIHQELRAFEVTGRHPHVVLLSWVVKLSQTPVNKAQLQRTK